MTKICLGFQLWTHFGPITAELEIRVNKENTETTPDARATKNQKKNENFENTGDPYRHLRWIPYNTLYGNREKPQKGIDPPNIFWGLSFTASPQLTPHKHFFRDGRSRSRSQREQSSANGRIPGEDEIYLSPQKIVIYAQRFFEGKLTPQMTFFLQKMTIFDQNTTKILSILVVKCYFFHRTKMFSQKIVFTFQANCAGCKTIIFSINHILKTIMTPRGPRVLAFSLSGSLFRSKCIITPSTAYFRSFFGKSTQIDHFWRWMNQKKGYRDFIFLSIIFKKQMKTETEQPVRKQSISTNILFYPSFLQSSRK